VTADGETVGCIAVWDVFDENGVHSLHVLYSMFEPSDLYLARADLAIGLLVTDIPQENGVPVPGDFPYIMAFDPPAQSYEFNIILPSQFDDVAYLYLATHALTSSGKDAWVLEDTVEYFIYILGTGVPPTPSPEPTLPPTTPGQGPTHVQSTSMSFGYGNQAEASITLPGPSTSGNLVIISFIYMDYSRTVESVTDSKGNVYNLALGPTHVGGNGWGNAYTYYARDIAGEGDPITITVTLSGLADDVFDVFASEYSGMDISEPLDQTSPGSGSGTAMESGVKTTTGAPELIYAFGAGDDYCHPTEPFTELETTNGQFTAYRIVSSLDSYGATGTQDIAGYWMLQMVTFKGA